ncbi:hypothetical protein lerEdw1_018932, partial [Lerista edwardsae]
MAGPACCTDVTKIVLAHRTPKSAKKPGEEEDKPLESLYCDDLKDNGVRRINRSPCREGLSPNHLKKAKLMFFYTRYPSSNMLKTYFSDVKFNRCITSQLIKWFSNFREFYYIQMEKYARQAINDGVTSTEELSITRDCELYRALNMHYNKANDFE